MPIHKDYKPLVKRIKNVGWQMEQLRSGHYRITGGSEVLHSTMDSGDPRAIKNLMSQLRMAGLEEAEAKLQRRKDREKEKQAAEEEAELAALMEEPQQQQEEPELVEPDQADLQEPKENPVSNDQKAGRPTIDEHTMTLIKFGKKLAGLGLKENDLKSIVEIIELGDSIGLTAKEVAEALKS